MKILYTSDLHGKTDFYREIITYSKDEKIDTVILGGDLLPRRKHSLDSLKHQENFIEREIHTFVSELKNESKISVYLILGNNDWAATLPLFRELAEANLLFLLHDQKYNLTEDLAITGYPYIPPTPFSPKDFEKRDYKEDPPKCTSIHPVVSTAGRIRLTDELNYFAKRSSIQEDLIDLHRSINRERMIYVMHAPPHNTLLDQMDDGSHLGSKAIRDFIDIHQPYITLHGHIHESPAVTGTCWQKIGKTLSINSGQIAKRLSAVIFDPNRPAETLFHTRLGIQKTISRLCQATP